MDNEHGLLTKNSTLVKAFPALKEKFIVDFANGIDVLNDLNRVQKDRQSFVSRMFDGFTGKSRRRQDQINANLKNGVEASLKWLVELTEELSLSNYAIVKVNDRVNELKFDVADLAKFSYSLKVELNHISDHFSKRCDDMQRQIDQLKSRQDAIFHLNFVFDKLRSSNSWRSLTVSQKLYSAYEELRWGNFGSFLLLYPNHSYEMLQALEQKTTLYLSDLFQIEVDKRIDLSNYLSSDVKEKSLEVEAIAYLGDWVNKERAPFIHCALQNGIECSSSVTIRPSPARISKHFVLEVFRG